MALAFVMQEELRARLQDDCDSLILDVRSQADYDGSSLKIKGAVRLQPDAARTLISQLDGAQAIIVYGRLEREEIVQLVVQLLRAQGFEMVYPLAGGFNVWLGSGYEVEPK